MVRRFKVLYDGQNETDDTIQLSMAHEEREIMWRRLKQMQEHDVTVPGRITAGNAGGAVVSVLVGSGRSRSRASSRCSRRTAARIRRCDDGAHGRPVRLVPEARAATKSVTSAGSTSSSRVTPRAARWAP